MPPPHNHRVAVDLGSSVITTVVAEQDEFGRIHVHGVGQAPAVGIEAGQITNVTRAAAAIRQSLDQAEAASGREIREVGIALSGAHLQSLNNRGAVALPTYGEPITWEDMERAVASGKAVSISPAETMLHAIPRYYIVDAERRCEDPRGQHGQRLDVEIHIVTASASAMQNAWHCVQSAGVGISWTAAKPVVASRRAIRDDERELGAVVIGLDAGTTSISAFEGGALSHTAVLPIGSAHIVRDLAIGLGCSTDDAADIMRQYGHAHPLLAAADGPEIELLGFSHAPRCTTPAEIAAFIYPRLSEIISMVGEHVTAHQLQHALSCGIVLTGRGAALQGVERVLGRAFQAPARVASTGQLAGLSDRLDHPEALGAVGLLQWMIDLSDDHASAQAAAPRSAEGGSMFTSLTAGVASIARVFSPHA